MKSRSFRLPVKGPWHESESVLVPWADTFNHGSTTNAKWSYVSDSGREGWYMMTDERIPNGSEIVHAYSKGLTNAELLNQYGFVLDENPDISKVTLEV